MVYLCPKKDCPNMETLQTNQKCPICGTTAADINQTEIGTLFVAKAEHQTEKTPQAYSTYISEKEVINPRAAIIALYGIAFIIAIVSIVSVPSNTWRYITTAEAISLFVSILMGLGGVLIAYWVWQDEQTIYELKAEIENLKKRSQKTA